MLIAVAVATADAQLYALNHSDATMLYRDDSPHVITLTSNGAFAEVSPFRMQGIVPHSAALDSTHGVYYFVGFNATDASFQPRLVGLSLKAGTVVSSVALPFAGEPGGLGQAVAFAGNLGAEEGEGLVVVTGQDATGHHLIGTVHPTTGAWNPVAHVSNQDGNVNPTSMAYVPKTQTFLFQLGVAKVITKYVLYVHGSMYIK